MGCLNSGAFVGAGLDPALTAYESARIFMGDVDKIQHVSGVTGRGQALPLQTPRIKNVIYTGDIGTADRRLLYNFRVITF
ncbi:MAG: hypothetical protein ABIN89_00890 [Chitinophagaceae bacterium]